MNKQNIHKATEQSLSLLFSLLLILILLLETEARKNIVRILSERRRRRRRGGGRRRRIEVEVEVEEEGENSAVTVEINIRKITTIIKNKEEEEREAKSLLELGLSSGRLKEGAWKELEKTQTKSIIISCCYSPHTSFLYSYIVHHNHHHHQYLSKQSIETSLFTCLGKQIYHHNSNNCNTLLTYHNKYNNNQDVGQKTKH